MDTEVDISQEQEISAEAIIQEAPLVCMGYLSPRIRHAIELKNQGLTGEAFTVAMRQFDNQGIDNGRL